MSSERREWSSAKLVPGSSSYKLAVLLEERELGARSLAKLIAPTPGQVEDLRKNVRRWLTGTTPNQASRDLVTDALGLERGALDPDDEEESLNAALYREMQDTRARFERLQELIEGRVG